MMTAPMVKLERAMSECAPDIDALYQKCVAETPNFGLCVEDLRAVLHAAVEKYLVNHESGSIPSVEAIKSFLSELQIHDLFLAQACAQGNENAWWEFDQSFRRYIERIARHLASAQTDAEEVLDSVYVELYGTRVVQGVRLSKFATYTGRGTLRGWLRTVVWHAVIDLHRAKHDEISLDEWSETGGESHERPGVKPETMGGETAMIDRLARDRYRDATVCALNLALSELDSHEKLLLLYYHVDNLKLREIARLVEAPESPLRQWFQRRSKQRTAVPDSRVHESTVMRWLEKVYARVLESFRGELVRRGLTAPEVAICLELATEDLATGDARRHLLDAAAEYSDPAAG
jgi:RNA polymerase sigma-70 factor